MATIWHYPRLQFARYILEGMKQGLLSRVSLFAPRKRGKTQFIIEDIIPLCKEEGILPVYVDFWRNKENPISVFSVAVDEAYSNNQTLFGKVLARVSLTSKISSGAGASLSVGLASESTGRAQDQNQKLESAFKKLNQCKNPILLLLDEVQHLATKAEFQNFTGSLRSFMVNNTQSEIKAIFTGSSQSGLTTLFNDTKAPFYNSTQTLIFKPLDDDFVKFELAIFKKVSKGVELDFEVASAFFKKQNNAPARLVELLGRMLLDCVYDMNEGIIRFNGDIESSQNSSYKKIITSLKALDVILFKLISMGEATGLYTESGRSKINALAHGREISTGKTAISNALNRLQVKGLIYSPQRGEWLLEDPSFRDYLLD